MEYFVTRTIMDTKRVYLSDHKPLNFLFQQNRNDFIVEEIPLERFSNKGNFLVMKIKKTDTSTWELLDHISKVLHISPSQIGYAGLKDKNATTTQYISIPLNKSKGFEKINSKNIKILQSFKHNEKIKIGDLKGNRFKIVLKDIVPDELHSFYRALSTIQKHGLPNYFGYQRFGKQNDFEKAKAVAYGDLYIQNHNLKKFLTAAYQSYLFNGWLAKRVELSKKHNSKKLVKFEGDILSDNGVVTGLMCGRKVPRAKARSGEIESLFDDRFIHEKGSRRDAWIKPENINNRYLKDENKMVLEFSLPKSSYATVLIEALLNSNLSF